MTDKIIVASQWFLGAEDGALANVFHGDNKVSIGDIIPNCDGRHNLNSVARWVTEHPEDINYKLIYFIFNRNHTDLKEDRVHLAFKTLEHDLNVIAKARGFSPNFESVWLKDWLFQNPDATDSEAVEYVLDGKMGCLTNASDITRVLLHSFKVDQGGFLVINTDVGPDEVWDQLQQTPRDFKITSTKKLQSLNKKVPDVEICSGVIDGIECWATYSRNSMGSEFWNKMLERHIPAISDYIASGSVEYYPFMEMPFIGTLPYEYIKTGILDCRDELHDPSTYVFKDIQREYASTWKGSLKEYLAKSEPIHIDPQYLTPNPNATLPHDGAPLTLHSPEIFDESTLAALGALGIY